MTRGMNSDVHLQDQMILSEFESHEGYDTDLNWQTKSRLDMLSASGGTENGMSNGNGLHSNGKIGSSGRRKVERASSLLDPNIEMSHSHVYQNDAQV